MGWGEKVLHNIVPLPVVERNCVCPVGVSEAKTKSNSGLPALKMLTPRKSEKSTENIENERPIMTTYFRASEFSRYG